MLCIIINFIIIIIIIIIIVSSPGVHMECGLSLAFHSFYISSGIVSHIGGRHCGYTEIQNC